MTIKKLTQVTVKGQLAKTVMNELVHSVNDKWAPIPSRV